VFIDVAWTLAHTPVIHLQLIGSQPVYLIPLHRAPATKIRHSLRDLVKCSFDEVARHPPFGKGGILIAANHSEFGEFGCLNSDHG
jgi:hypothetical protein